MPINAQYAGRPVASSLRASGNVTIWWEPKDGFYHMTFPFNAAVVDLLKQVIPANNRHWDPTTKNWLFEEPFLPGIIAICETIFYKQNIFVTSKLDAEKQKTTPVKSSAPITDVFTQFCNLLPYESMLSAYRNAAVALHPDKAGGSAKLMSLLNVLWTRIKVEHYKK